MEKHRADRCRRLVLVPYPLQGHITPMLELATALHSKGFSITIAHTKFNSPNALNHPDFTFVPISDGISDWNISPGNLVALASTINSNCEEPFRKCLTQLIKQQEQDGTIACIIYDFLMYFAEAIANQLKLQSIILRTSNAASQLALSNIPRLQAQGYNSLQDPTSEELVPELDPLRFKDLPVSKIGNLGNFLQLIATASDSRTSSAIIFNTIDCLEHSSLAQLEKQYTVPFFHIGPLHKIAPTPSTSLLKEDTNCIEWLNKQAPKSVLYISLGSIAMMGKKELAEMAWGLADSNQPFLWVVRPSSVSGSEELFPEGFEQVTGERACIVKWAPQKDLLKHNAIGGFWSHCGWNSTLESLCEGVPIICNPYFIDQKVNARYLTHVWKVGLEVGDDTMQRTEIERAVRRLLVEEEGNEMRQRALEYKERIKNCIGEGGSSYSSFHKLVEFISSF